MFGYTIVVEVKRHYLSDRSEVFSVHIGDVELQAVSERDAIELAHKINDAIRNHTNDGE